MKIQDSDIVKKNSSGDQNKWRIKNFFGFVFLLILFFFSGVLLSRELAKKGLLKVNFNQENEIKKEVGISELYSPYELWSSYDLPALSFKPLEGQPALDLENLGEENHTILIRENGLDPLEADIKLVQDNFSGSSYYRITLEEDQKIFGMSDFYLLISSELNFGKIAFAKNAENEGLLTPHMNYVYIYSGDKSEGIYLLTEQLPQLLDEITGLQNGFFIWFDQDETSGVNTSVSVETVPAFDYSFIDVDENNEKLQLEYVRVNKLLNDYQKGIISVKSVFDVAKLGKYYALLDIWNVSSQRTYYYYNPKTELIEPVFTNLNFSFTPDDINSKISAFLGDWIFYEPFVRESYAKELFRMTKSDYLSSLAQNIMEDENMFTEIFRKTYENEYGIEYQNYWVSVNTRSKVLSLEFTPYQTIHGTYTVSEENGEILEIHLANLMLLPVEISAVQVGDIILPIGDERISISESSSLSEQYAGYVLNPIIHPDDYAPEAVQLLISLDKADVNQEEETIPEIRIITRIAGLETDFFNSLVYGKFPEIVQSNPLPEQPSLAEILETHSFLNYSEEEDILVVFPGDWDVDGDLILPDGIGLKILPGTSLRFDEEKIIFSNAPVQIKGSSAAPVYLTAKQTYWGGIAVIKAEDLSSWKYVTLDKIKGSDEYGDMLGIVRGAWVLTSGINFYYSPLNLDHVKILNTNTEDAINLIHSDFVFDSSEFAFAFADAFDSDFSEGEILDCYFHDIGGDAIDASGSELLVNNVRIQNVLDKGISAGEESVIRVKGAELDNVVIGVASKDLSEVFLDGININAASTAALAAYIKKNVFGPASISAENLLITNSSTEVIVQTGCEIMVDGKVYETIELDVKDLYEKGILGN